MSGSNFSGTFKQFGIRVRLDLAARRALKQRVRLLRILHRAVNERATWETPYPGRSDPR
jgi:hypothetical protein